MDHEPEEDLEEQEEPDLPLIDTETFYDLLMEQQEQMQLVGGASGADPRPEKHTVMEENRWIIPIRMFMTSRGSIRPEPAGRRRCRR